MKRAAQITRNELALIVQNRIQRIHDAFGPFTAKATKDRNKMLGELNELTKVYEGVYYIITSEEPTHDEA